MTTPTPYFENIIIGAGAAGMSAGFELKRRNIPFHILEASESIGGRIRKVDPAFDVDINLEIGGSFIHYVPALREVTDAIGIPLPPIISLEGLPYEYYDADRERWIPDRLIDEVDHIWTNNTWYQLFETHVYPSIQEDITFGCAVTTIDYTDPMEIAVTCEDGRAFVAENVVVAVSAGMLQSRRITFKPALPTATQSAIDSIAFVNAIKVFIEFEIDIARDRKIFSLYSANPTHSEGYDEYFFWDASYQQGSDAYVLGCILENESGNLNAGVDLEELFKKILAALDLAFDNQATPNVIQKTMMDWSVDPYSAGAWTTYGNADNQWITVFTDVADRPIQDRVYFAGDYLTYNGWYGEVDAAAISGQIAVCLLTGESIDAWEGPCQFDAASVRTDNPAVSSPVTAAPVTAAPVTAAPVTVAPVTAAPVTAAAVTAAPVTAAPIGGPLLQGNTRLGALTTDSVLSSLRGSRNNGG